ncbi:IS66 family insertion sequence element accessory protein TnpB [Vibrio celticus]|uniref:IS66 family insertion sequence element accessory protein TnpB n=1 Tax=Vibrio celticus TaxID=446372 RepID=UPI0036F353F2
MRKSIDGLSLIVADVLEMDPLSSAWFIFAIVAEIKSKFSLGHQRILALLSPIRERPL